MKEFKDGMYVQACNQCCKKVTFAKDDIKNWVSLIGLTGVTFQGTEIQFPLYPDKSSPDLDFCSSDCILEFFIKYFKKVEN